MGRTMEVPRVFCIPATEAPVVAVLRRGPTDWCHVGRWNLDDLSFESGAWFRGTLYPQKCDLSPDGRWLVYSALKWNSDWAAGDIYEAVSRLPWLHALAAWEAGTTYTRGAHFDEATRECGLGDPDVGDVAPLLRRYGLALNRPVQFCVERRRGWSETEDTVPRSASDNWDERRVVRMRKPRPGSDDGSGVELRVEGSYAAFRSSPDHRTPAEYSIETDAAVTEIDAQWADWDARGRLLLCTTEGRLRVCEDPDRLDRPMFDYDLSALAPEPLEPPEWARAW